MEKDGPIPPIDEVAAELTGSGTLQAEPSKRKPPRLRGSAEVRERRGTGDGVIKRLLLKYEKKMDTPSMIESFIKGG